MLVDKNTNVEIIAKFDEYCVLKKFYPNTHFVLAKLKEDGTIENEIDLTGLQEVDHRELLGDSNHSEFKLAGVLLEVNPTHSKNQGFGIVADNGNVCGFYFKNSDEELVHKLNNALNRPVILKGSYINSSPKFNPKLPVWNVVDTIDLI